MIFVTRAELEAALASSPDVESAAHLYVTEQLAAANADASEIDLDLSGTSWEFFFQDIVKRSKTLTYVSVVAAFTCSKMRPDGFGGMAVLITRDAIVGKSTNDLLEDFLAEAGLRWRSRRRERRSRTCRDSPSRLRVRGLPGHGRARRRKRARRRACPFIRSRSPDHVQDVLRLRFPKVGFL